MQDCWTTLELDSRPGGCEMCAIVETKYFGEKDERKILVRIIVPLRRHGGRREINNPYSI
jgi:hypothetical protein